MSRNITRSMMTIVALLTAVSMVLSACGGATAPTAAPQPQQPAATPY